MTPPLNKSSELCKVDFRFVTQTKNWILDFAMTFFQYFKLDIFFLLFVLLNKVKIKFIIYFFYFQRICLTKLFEKKRWKKYCHLKMEKSGNAPRLRPRMVTNAKGQLSIRGFAFTLIFLYMFVLLIRPVLYVKDARENGR